MKRKNMMGRNLAQTIKTSFGRYIAIVGIVALGAMLFCGLRVTKVDMVATVQRYTDQQNMFDLQVMNSYGWTEENVSALAQADGIADAEGCISIDALMHFGGDDVAYKLISLPDEVNQPALSAGRMPQKANECLLDDFTHGQEFLGQTVHVSANNEEDTLDNLAYDEYTVVGLVNTPLYLNMQRGSTSIGSGSLRGFLYIPREGFSLEYFTEINLTMEGNYAVYTDRFDDAMDKTADDLEPLAQAQADSRYNSILAEAEESFAEGRQEYLDGVREYHEGKEEADQTLRDALKKLEDGQKELEDNRQTLIDGRAELVNGQQAINENLQTLADSRDALAQAKKDTYQELADAQALLDEKYAQAADGLAQVNDGLAQIDDGLAQLEDGIAQIDEGLAQIDDGLAQIDEGLAQIDDGLAQIEDGLAQIDDYLAQIDDGLAQIDEGIAQLEDAIAQIDDGLAQIDEAMPLLDKAVDLAQKALDALQKLPDSDSQAIAKLEAKLQELVDQREALVAQRSELIETRAQCEAQLADIQAQKAELTAQREELLATREETLAQKDGLLAKREEVAAQREDLLAQREPVAAQREDVLAQREDVLVQKQELLDTKAEIEDGLVQIQDGYDQLAAGKAEANAQFVDAQAQIDDGEAQLRDAQNLLNEKWAELSDGEKALADGEKELEDGWADYYEGKEEAEAELADAREELRKGLAELTDARADIDAIEAPTLYTLTRNTNVGYVLFESDSDIVAGVAKIFPVFFLAVAALVCITTMSRMIDEERTQIGVMKALGYSSAAIMGKYLAYSGSACLAGCLVGIAMGSTVFPQLIWNAYCIMYNFSEKVTLSYDIGAIVFIFVSYLGLTLLVTWNCCRKELQDVPAELIRPKPPVTGKQIFLEKLPFWGRLKFLNKVAIRNIFRYRQRLAMMLLGIGGCTALLVTGFGLGDSISDIVSYQFENVMVYDLSVTFDEGLDSAAQAEFRDTFPEQRILFCQQSGIDVDFDSSVKNVNFLAVDESLDGFIDLHDKNGSLPLPKENEALISIGAASAMGIHVGDTVTLRNSDLEELKVSISGIFNNNVYNYVIVSGDTVRGQWGRDPEMQTAYVLADPNQEIHDQGARMAGYDGVITTSINQDLADTVGNMMKALDSIILVVVACAGALAGIVLYNLTNINIQERIREIATIKVLGFNAMETTSYVFKENLALTAVGALLGLIGGKGLHALVMSYVRIDMVWFENRIDPGSYVLAAVLTILAAFVVDFAMYFKLEKINMAEALKSVE